MHFLEHKFSIQGHRGARGIMPENTVESCTAAVDCRVEGIEIDVVVSKDKQIVLSHEPWMSPVFCSYPDGKPVTTEGVLLQNMDYEDLKLFDCGKRQNPKFKKQKSVSAYKPTLNKLIKNVYDYCDFKKSSKPFFNIEIKSHPKWYYRYVPPPTEFTRLLAEPLSMLEKNNFYISSFDPYFLNIFKKQYPKIPIAYLVENQKDISKSLQKLGFKPTIFSPYYKDISSKMVSIAHQKGIKIFTWTVNDKRDVSILKEKGVDGVITDYPNLIFNSK